MAGMTARILFALLLFAAPAFAEGGLSVPEMVITTKIVKGDPVDSVKSISSSSVDTLFCFTRVEKQDEGEATIRHIWSRNGQPEGEYELPVRGTRWRTYSKKRITISSSGDWKVDAVDSSGAVLGTVEFRIN